MMRLCQLAAASLCLFMAIQTATAQMIRFDMPSGVDFVKEERWRFKAGDSLIWRLPAYNHERWPKVSPLANLTDNAALWKSGQGWFRTAFQLRQVGVGDLAVSIRQFGTSEVYLDGKRVAVLRPARFAAGGSQRLVGLVPLPVTDTGRHILAIRYAFRRDRLLSNTVSKSPFQLSFQQDEQAFVNLLDNQNKATGLSYLLAGVFSILSLLHWLFYRANRAQRVNFTLALTMLVFALIFIGEQIGMTAGSLTLDSLIQLALWIMVNIALGLLLLSVYVYLRRRLGVLFWGIVLVLTVLVISAMYNHTIDQGNAFVPFLLVLIEYIRVSWVARRKHKDPLYRLPWNSLKFSFFSILGVTALALVVGLLSNGFTEGGSPEWLTLPMALLGLCTIFSVPVGLSFSLVGDYARTYQSLRQQLDRVNELSAQTLAQEQEKQHLLASQNERLEKQVADRTAELHQSLMELRETQTQLIQREKLASLGELTAGIAHEIQNPLNFVNNFSEVSSELVAELTDEHGKDRPDHELETELLTDLALNLQKITHHGKRASSIVKGMLEHSRSIAGDKQPADLNALADEYLKLSFQAMRAKDSAFQATLVTEFDPNLGLVPIVTQEIGRVLLNLFNNAFYALHKRQQQAEPGFVPTLRVTTARTDADITVQIRDNGTGIPESARQKIFQPFFTTKPSGEGTGLGLSLSYDIITKGYGGTIALKTEEGQFTEFTITIPV